MKFNLAFWLSLILAAAGCTGLVLAGKGKWYGWAIGLAVQPVWVIFGIITKGYGLCLTALMYGYVYSKNLITWRREQSESFQSGPWCSTQGCRARWSYSHVDCNLSAMPKQL